MRTLLLTLSAALACGALAAKATTQNGGTLSASVSEMSEGETLLEPGVSRALARWRAAHYRDVRYALSVALEPGAETIQGTLEMRVTLDLPARDLVLDWRPAAPREGKTAARVWNVEVNGRAARETEARSVSEHLVVARSLLKSGENVLRMSFESPVSAAGSAAVTRYRDRQDGAEYLYTLFVPSDASTAFPCFDQPDLKARFRLHVSAPPAWTVVSNTDAETVTMNGAAPKFIRFQETRPISTYVFAFAAGEFAEFNETDVPTESALPRLRLYVRKSQAERARKELREVFRLNREGLKFFERYFDYKFPFPKYDLVVIPEFPFRGMEHAGATFLREESVIFPTDPTANDLWSRADIMLHEAAHQWFGDTVTMRWFDDLWLKEGFATFMASKAVEKLLPQYDAWKVFYLRTKPLAYETDVTKGTTPIWQEIQNLSAAKSAYGNIVYRKAPSMLRQAEFYLGADNFQQSVRLFLKEHAFANAEWDDLVRAFERTSGQKLGAWADAWVRRRGMADVRVRVESDIRGRVTNFKLMQKDVLGEGGAWPMRLRVLLAYDEGAAKPYEVLNVKLDGSSETYVSEASGKPRPAYVFANYEDYGYGRFLLDPKSLRSVRARLGSVREDFLRALLWGTLWDSVRAAELAPADFIELAIAHVARERDEVAAQFILSRVEIAFNRYLSEEQRRALARPLETVLFNQMLKAETAGLRITYFRAYRQVATSARAEQNLRRLLRGELSVPGMTLRARDRFDIIASLLARADASPLDAELLQSFSRNLQTDDERRYAYAAAAALGTAANKQKYFDAYLNDKELAESWAEVSLAPFNSLRQSRLTLPYLEPALRELPNLKRTRKIFFVNAWLAAFIGGQCSEPALHIVGDFLARERGLERDLRLKVLEAGDSLERCVRIRAKYARRAGENSRPAS